MALRLLVCDEDASNAKVDIYVLVYLMVFLFVTMQGSPPKCIV